MSISVIVPAFNEERYLPATLDAVARSAALLEARVGVHSERIVVDNGSTDRTASLARSLGARVIAESQHNIARVRNC
jgi:glycosyltransferase involved in cell wall biosynthesis